MELEEKDIEIVAELPYRWELLKNKTILISGGTGFIGTFFSNVIKYRNSKYKENIKIISLSRRGGESDDTITCVRCDITNPIILPDKIDYILHLASNTHPKQYGEDPVGTIITNIVGCDNLLKIAVEKQSKFLLASSVEIYGQGTSTPMDETYCGYIDCNNARSGYNEAKRVSEALCQSYKQKYGVDVLIARFSRIFGADRKEDSKAMSQFMDKAISGEDIILKSQGLQRFSYCYIADAVSGLIKILTDGESGEAYNVSANDEGMTLGEYAQYIAKLANKQVIFDFFEDSSASKATFALLDTKKICSIGWKPLYTVKDGILETYKIKKNRLHFEK